MNNPHNYTKYEIARILGARALQLSMNAPLLLTISKEQLEEISYDPLKIAEMEFNADILPITVKRPFPKKIELQEEEIVGEELEIEEGGAKPEEVVKEKEDATEEAIPPPETEDFN